MISELDYRRPDTYEDESEDDGLTGLVDIYLKQIGSFPLLKAEDERHLGRLYQESQEILPQVIIHKMAIEEELGHPLTWEQSLVAQGIDQKEYDKYQEDGAKASDKMIVSNLRLVVSRAKKKIGRGLSLMDLIQIGNLGLIKAVKKFDYRRGLKFSGFAVAVINRFISLGIAGYSNSIRIPANIYYLTFNLDTAKSILADELGRKPTSEELAKECNVRLSWVEYAEKRPITPLSLNQTLTEDNDTELGDLVPSGSDEADPAHQMELTDRRDKIRKSLESLDNMERRVIALRFGLDDGVNRTLEEVGHEIERTRERARQIEAKALSKLRHPSSSQHLKDFLDI